VFVFVSAFVILVKRETTEWGLSAPQINSTTMQIASGAVAKPTDETHRSRFTLEEDIKLRGLVQSLGNKNWEEIARFMPSRTARQCRDRFKNYLTDFLVTNPWTAQEDTLLIHQYHMIGPKWVEIGKMLSGRSGNNVKNRWHKHLSKRERASVPTGAFLAPTPRTDLVDDPEVVAPCPISEGRQFDWRDIFQSFDTPAPSNFFFSFGDSLS
jgi:hypothetical protein